jgi:hypothetical protein
MVTMYPPDTHHHTSGQSFTADDYKGSEEEEEGEELQDECECTAGPDYREGGPHLVFCSYYRDTDLEEDDADEEDETQLPQ